MPGDLPSMKEAEGQPSHARTPPHTVQEQEPLGQAEESLMHRYAHSHRNVRTQASVSCIVAIPNRTKSAEIVAASESREE